MEAGSVGFRLLLAAVLGCFALQAILVFTQPANWDEFRFLSDVHLYARGALAVPVQTFHVHFFGWLVHLPGHELDQILAARTIMLLLEGGTAAMIFLCARRFAGAEASLFAVLCYLSFSVVMRHGASFRYDPPSTFLLMAAVTTLTIAPVRLRSVALAASCTAVAGLITIKAVFYVPTLALIACWRIQDAPDRLRTLRTFVGGAAIGAILLASLYLVHQAQMAAASIGGAQEIVTGSVEKTIGQSRIPAQPETLIASMAESLLNWLILLAAVQLALWQAVRTGGEGRARAVALAGFALPLATLLFYRNSFAYYYVFMLAPVAVLVAPLAERGLLRRRRDLAAAILVLGAGFNAAQARSPVLAAQRATLDAVHRIFPSPVAYIDRCSMVAAFDKQGLFMSSWGVERYRDAGQPVMRRILEESRPALLLVNAPALARAMHRKTGNELDLLPADAATLRENYIPHWGVIWVAGKTMTLGARPVAFEILVPGRYTLEGAAPVRVDGVERTPGEVVLLGAGMHRAAGPAGERLTLRWGSRLPRPAASPPAAPVFGRL
jgi:hypothetical protein